ncbi:MAG: class II aldolase/adducin family protein [Candidatus Omnitrophica bacterium]|nr:class II aldolase/adducin family protein [Candidatus Omnitrophota bacterium]
MLLNKFNGLKNGIIESGKSLWDKGLASGLNGNISLRAAVDKYLITATKTCLGNLSIKDILLVDIEGNVLEKGSASTEKLLHGDIYKNFPLINAVIHTHTPYSNGYFLSNKKFIPQVHEARLWFGEIEAIDQDTPSVLDTSLVIKALNKNSIVVLKRHGLVAAGNNLTDCFYLIQGLEEAIKTDFISRAYAASSAPGAIDKKGDLYSAAGHQYKMFSPEHIDEIVKYVNNDRKMQELGAQTKMTMELAVKIEGSEEKYRFSFRDGKILSVSNDENAEFVISAPSDIWRAVFKREIDPFVATTQKKMSLKGDFGKISKWYAPCSRIFELWSKVAIE